MGQSVHAATALDVVYLPAAHAVHMLDPLCVPWFAISPAGHWAHAVVESAENVPGGQRVHATAPDLSVAATVFVVDPGPQARHCSGDAAPV